MFRIRWMAPCLLLVALSGLARPVTAQVVEIQVLPPDLNLTVGETGNVIATLFDGRGNPITTAAPLTWVSNNLSVATVEFNTASPNFARVMAVSPGIAQIQARSGGITSTVVVAVQAAPIEEPEALPAVTPDSVLPGDISNTSISLVARVQPYNFGFAQECRVGGFVGTNLLLTTYLAIRGADSLVVVTSDGQRVTTGVRVAAYDAPSDLAVLHVPVQRSGEFTVGDDPVEDDYVWAVGQPNCRTTQTTRAVIADVPSTGAIDLSEVLGLGQVGAPVVNQAGEVVAIASEGSKVIRATDIASMATQARRNLATGSLLTPIQVARAERHAHGSLALRSNMTNAVARIAPLEDWHWPGLAQQSPLPLTFSGPEGRYQIELVASGAVQSATTVTMEAGVANQVLLTPTLLAQQETPPPEPETPPGAQITPEGGGGGGGAIIAVVLVLAGGGAAAAFLLKPKDEGGPPVNGGNGGGSGLGSIRITLPSR
jgi:hypothetical protein